ncbi:intracellular traffic protein-related [Holotrichia oblita]|uniref:Intracellular traffic protein-related n=1 Tax=Holotrichia oblita TaxID=644536 RepID=A0ACB9T867_HOLOL|nr:intracellular traffic protein-related [Holotrichia oblita]
MSAHLLCLTSGSGLPIFTRSKGNTETLPFSVIGSLNAVHMYSKSHKMALFSTSTEDYCFVWNEFQESIVLIGIAAGCTKEVLQKVLQSCFNAMVLVVGFDEICSQRNIERLKRELRIALNTYSECVDSMFSCVLIHGRIAAATENWWNLSSDELKLLTLLASAESISANKDIPVFLPQKSPNAAFRFVAITLISDVQVCCLCGPTPSLEEIEFFLLSALKA